MKASAQFSDTYYYSLSDISNGDIDTYIGFMDREGASGKDYIDISELFVFSSDPNKNDFGDFFSTKANDVDGGSDFFFHANGDARRGSTGVLFMHFQDRNTDGTIQSILFKWKDLEGTAVEL